MNLSMLNQARELKSRMNKVQKELSKTTLEINSRNGEVKVIINGQQEIRSIKISPTLMNPDKPETLEKLVLRTVSDAITTSKKVAAKQLKEVTGGINIPGLT